MERPILLLCGCRKYEEYLRAAIRRMTHPDAWEVIAVLGGASATSFEAATGILTVAAPDTYEALPSKIHAAFAWIAKERPGIPGVFKTDDDVVFDVGALADAIEKHTAKPYWGVAVGVCNAGAIPETRIRTRFADTTLRPTHQRAAYCIGWGYWISAAALPYIVAAADDYASSYLEDVCTGFVMNRAGIKPDRIRVTHKELVREPNLLLM